MRTCRYFDADGDDIHERNPCEGNSNGCIHFRSKYFCPFYTKGTPSSKKYSIQKQERIKQNNTIAGFILALVLIVGFILMILRVTGKI
jgi:hypothetical protein